MAALATLPLLLACKIAGFWTVRLFSGSWRHVSVQDVEDIVRGNVLASALFLSAMVFFRGLEGFPRAVFLLDLLLCTGDDGWHPHRASAWPASATSGRRSAASRRSR